jgi:putative phage-type endonuclease
MPKFVDVEQGSEGWLALRREKVTATDISKIMGISIWGTALDVFNDKQGNSKPFITNPGIEFGRRMEEPIREHYESKVGEWFPPAVVVNDWSLASLDGINSSKTRILEIKTCNKKVFEEAQFGHVPSYYKSQVQYGMMCIPSVKDCEFVFYNSGSYAYVIVERDEEYIANLKIVGKEFYDQCIVDKQPPALSEKDSIDLSDDPQWMCLASEARLLYPKLKQLEKEWKELRGRLQDCTDDGNSHGGGVSITKTWRIGSIDTDKLENDGIDIEKYRKSSTSSLRLTVDKDFDDK